MKEVIKQVTVRELYDILLAKSGKNVSYESFLFQLMNGFLTTPALEFKYHDEDHIYVLKHQEIAKAIEAKRNPQVPSESRAGEGE